MEDNKNAIDVDYVDIGNEIYLTAPQIAQKINDTDIRVRHWGDSFGDIIGLEKVNGRKRYKESDTPKFAFIKELLDNKKFTHEQAKSYLSKYGFKYAEYNSGLVNTKDPLGFQALASALSVEVSGKLSQFSEDMLSNISNQLSDYIKIQQNINMQMKAELESAVDEIVTEKLEPQQSQIDNIIEEKLNEFKDQFLEEMKQELAVTKEDSKNIQHLKELMEQRQIESNEVVKVSLWDKIFNR